MSPSKRKNSEFHTNPIQLIDDTENSDIEEQSTTPWVSVTVTDPIIEKPINSYSYVTYLLTLTASNGHINTIRKRYSQFDELRRKLKSQFGNHLFINKLPPKTTYFLNELDPKFVEGRRRGLEYWLATVILDIDVGNCDLIREFVSVT